METGRYGPKSGVSQNIWESWQHCFWGRIPPCLSSPMIFGTSDNVLCVKSLSLVISSLYRVRSPVFFESTLPRHCSFSLITRAENNTFEYVLTWFKQNETTAPFSSRYEQQHFRTWGARKTAGVARAQTLNCQVLGLRTGTILQDCTRSFVAHKKLENVSEENEKKLIHCPRKSLIFQDFQGPTHIFQVFQAWILKF